MDNGLNQAVAETIRAELSLRGIAPTALAPALDVSPQTMLNLVKSDAPWRVSYLEAIARVLEMSVTAIIDRADPTGELSNFEPAPAQVFAVDFLHREADENVDADDLAWVADGSPDEDALRAERGEYPAE